MRAPQETCPYATPLRSLLSYDFVSRTSEPFGRSAVAVEGLGIYFPQTEGERGRGDGREARRRPRCAGALRTWELSGGAGRAKNRSLLRKPSNEGFFPRHEISVSHLGRSEIEGARAPRRRGLRDTPRAPQRALRSQRRGRKGEGERYWAYFIFAKGVLDTN